ncbi:hypothetical protein A8B78_16310 [Jannaschia sp. EhC01]|nr:hypothetical protein A8B78_16310 [Jannaschia sp. EhC01]
MARFLFILIFTLAVLPATAQEAPLRFPLGGVLALANQAYLDRNSFERALTTLFPLAISPERPPDTAPIDPFLWSLSGSFGGTGAHPRPGAIFECTRYGLATREVFAAEGMSSARTFALMRYARPQFDDATNWPEGAVARLHCVFVWDDVRVVEIMPESASRAPLATLFQTLTDQPSPSQVYGAAGYRIDATGGPDDSVVQVESARMTLTLGHQSLSFRSFLMAGGS